MQQHRQGDGQGQEGDVHQGRVTVHQEHLVQFQVNAGVYQDASEGDVEVSADGNEQAHEQAG